MTNDMFEPTKGLFEPSGMFDKTVPKVKEEDKEEETEELTEEEKKEEE